MTKRALISVSDKTGIVEFAKGLKEVVSKLFQLVEQAKHFKKMVYK